MEIGQEDVKKILPHRDPFLFVDVITRVDLAQMCLTGTRFISPDDPIFAGHFPGDPVYPGVLQLEVMGQFGICLAHFVHGKSTAVGSEHVPRAVRAIKVHHAAFLDGVKPSELLTVHAKVVDYDEFTATCAGQLLGQDGTIKTVSAMEVYFLD